MKIVLAAVGAVTLVAGGVLLDQALLSDPYAEFFDACEETLKDRLKAPSTFRMLDEPTVTATKVSAAVAAGPPPDDFRGTDQHTRLQELHELQLSMYRDGAWRHRALIEYEAQNAFGTPIRNVSRCDAYTFDEAPPTSRYGNVRVQVDGKSAMEWLTDQVRGG